MLRQDDFIRSQLVLYGWQHGKKYGGHLASEMIMHVIANRFRLGWGNWLDILDSAPKYAANNVTNKDVPQIWAPEFVRLLHSVETIYDGSTKDLSNGAVYFADLSEPIDNEWFKTKIINEPLLHPRIAEMNSLAFFR